MDHVLIEHGLRLTYLRELSAIDDLDQDRILQELSDDTLDSDSIARLTRRPLTHHDHLILATDRCSGGYLGLLGASDGITANEEFLLLETAFVAATARGQNLLRRLIALALLRIGSLGAAPSVIAMRTRDPICYHILRGIADRLTRAAFFPEPADIPINLHTAALAQRIAREIHPNSHFQIATGTIRGAAPPVDLRYYRPYLHAPQIDGLFGQKMQPADRILAVLDLRLSDEITIFDDARRIYRARKESSLVNDPSRRTSHPFPGKIWQGATTVADTTDAPIPDRMPTTLSGTP